MRKRILTYLLISMGVVVILGGGCKKEETLASTLPTVTTSPVLHYFNNYAYGEGEVTKEGGSSILHKEVCWSTNNNPSLSNVHSDEGFGTGLISSKMEPLIPNTTYYVKAYATNANGTAYGIVVSFTTTK
jgi:hypothetical protein